MYSKKIIDYCINTTWDLLPKEIQHQAKRVFLDNLGAMIIGSKTPTYEITKNYVLEQFKGGEIPLLKSNQKTSTVGASLAYGVAANAVDIDDGCRLAKGHPGAHVIPATLIAALKQKKCSGKEFLTALVLGYETAIRAAYIRHATCDVYHSSGSWGAIGAATSIAKIYGYNYEQMYNTLGTASYFAPIAPMMVGIEVPSMGKDSIGWGVHVGMSSAELAKHGFTASNPIFDQSPNEEWCNSIGSIFEIMHLFFKPYSACPWAQAGVDGVMNIVRQYQIKNDEIDKIIIHTFSEAAALSREYPKNTEYAQYNFAYPIAVAAFFGGEVHPEKMLPPTIFDERLYKMMDKIEVVIEEKYQQMFPAKTVANVELIDTKGNRYESGDLSPRWDLSNTLPTDQELEHKFRWILENMYDKQTLDSFINLLWNFDSCDDINELLPFLL